MAQAIWLEKKKENVHNIESSTHKKISEFPGYNWRRYSNQIPTGQKVGPDNIE